MKNLLFLKVIFLWMLIHLTWSSIPISENWVRNVLQESQPAVSFIACRHENSTHVDMKKSLNATIAEKLIVDRDSPLKVKTIIKAFPGIRDFIDKFASCSLHFTKCFENRYSIGNICYKKSIYFGMVSNMRSIQHSLDVLKDLRAAGYLLGPKSYYITKDDGWTIVISRTYEENYKSIYIPIGGQKHNRRQLRRPSVCAIPQSLNTAELSCRIYPRITKCVQRCAFGHTLTTGIKLEMECNSSDNVWKPNGFQECKPFVDCNLSLKSPGSVSCVTMTTRDGPECSIECLHFEDKPTVTKKNYSCTIEGDWDPPLPYCAAPGAGLQLRKAPVVKVHRND